MGVGRFIQVRYTVPPDGDPNRFDTPGRNFYLQSPDLDGTGTDPGTSPSEFGKKRVNGLKRLP